MKTRRFALVVARYPLELALPPGEDYFAEPARMMAEAGCEVEFLTLRHPGQAGREQAGPALIRRFDSVTQTCRALVTGRYDLVHAHSHFRPALLSGLIAGRAGTVFTSHSYAVPPTAWKRRVLAGLMNRFDRIIALTPYEREVYASVGVVGSRVTVIAQPINVGFFSGAGDAGRFRAQWNLPADAPVILFVANLRPVKNPGVVLRAFEHVRRELPAARLVIVGRNMLGPDSAAILRAEGVVRTDWLAPEPLRDALAAAAVVVNSSSHEGFPLSVFEAAAASRPCCLPDIGSLKSLTGLRALYHAPEDAGALAGNVLRYLREPALAGAEASANRAFVEQFDTPRVIEQWSRLYGSLLEG